MAAGAIDISNVYVGLEFYNNVEEDGNSYDIYELSTYYLEAYYECEKTGTYILYNWDTEEEVMIDYHGNVLDWCDSKKNDIYSITKIRSLKEIVDAFLEGMGSMDIQTEDQLLDFKNIQTLLTDSMNNNKPANVEPHDAIQIVGMAQYLYTLGFGDPISQESGATCRIKFLNGRY